MKRLAILTNQKIKRKKQIRDTKTLLHQTVTLSKDLNDQEGSVTLEISSKTRQWYRTYGDEYWEFNGDGLMTKREMIVNDIPVLESKVRIKIN